MGHGLKSESHSQKDSGDDSPSSEAEIPDEVPGPLQVQSMVILGLP